MLPFKLLDFEYLKKSAELWNPNAMAVYGNILYQKNDIPNNKKIAIEYLKKTSDFQCPLGIMHYADFNAIALFIGIYPNFRAKNHFINCHFIWIKILNCKKFCEYFWATRKFKKTHLFW